MLMRRKRDGKLAAYDQAIIDEGYWEPVVEEVKPPPKPKPPQIPRSQRPVKPLVRETDPEQVVALFEPPVIPEAQTCKVTPAETAEDVKLAQ
jgi:hypothetical protein